VLLMAPLFVVRGAPTPEELAVVLAVVAARGQAQPAPEAPVQRSLWATPVLPAPVVPGPGAWRAAALPR
jgi:hypothetical protein